MLTCTRKNKDVDEVEQFRNSETDKEYHMTLPLADGA